MAVICSVPSKVIVSTSSKFAIQSLLTPPAQDFAQLVVKPVVIAILFEIYIFENREAVTPPDYI
jgi:hypothetical protein